MNIVLWAPFGAGTHYWGPGTSAYRLYKRLENEGVKITLVHGSDSQELFPEVYSEQIKISSLDKKSKLASILFLIKSLYWIRKNYHKYDAFHGISAFYYTFLPALYFNKFRSNTFIKITGAHGGFGDNSIISRVLGFSRFRLSRANSISGYISISSYITSNLIGRGIDKDKIFSIPNGVDENRFIPAKSDSYKKKIRLLNNIPNKLTFVYVGGLTQNKRIINIIHSAKILRDEGVKNFQFLIVGPDRVNGVIESEIQKLIFEFQLEEIVLHIKFTKEPEVFFQLSDVFILVSETEGMSNSLLEAMSCGLPAIVTKISGSEDLIQDGINGLYSDGSPEDIARCMKFFALGYDHIEEFGANSRSQILKYYSSKIIIDQHIKLFSNEY